MFRRDVNRIAQAGAIVSILYFAAVGPIAANRKRGKDHGE